MITASEARALASYESRLANVIDTLTERVVAKAPHAQKTTLMFNLSGSYDTATLRDDVKKAFLENGFDITSQEVWIEGFGGSEVLRTEFTVSWAED